MKAKNLVLLDLSASSGTGNAGISFNELGFDGTLIMACNEKRGRITAPFKFDSKRLQENDGNDSTLYKTKKFGGADIEVKVSTGTGRASVKDVEGAKE